jgi:hypothetical protein
MAIDSQGAAGASAEKINPANRAELESWAKVWGVTFTQVRAAIMIVGPKVADVQKYLKK